MAMVISLESGTVDSATIPAGSMSTTYVVKTDDDEVGEADGKITVSLRDDIVIPVNYTISPSELSAEVAVTDNDGGLTVSVSTRVAAIDGRNTAEISAIVEGDSAKFYIESSAVLKTSLDIDISVTGGSNFLVGTAPSEVTIPAGENEVILELATDDDSQVESSETITVTVQDSTGYNVATGGGAFTSITVVDNDGTNVLPVIRVEADSVDAITEGAMANFTIRSDRAIDDTNGLEVRLLVSDGEGDFINGAPATSATILATQNSIPLQVPTVQDTNEEADGRIVVTVLNDDTAGGIDYVINPDQNNAAVTVWNDDFAEGQTAPVQVGVSKAINVNNTEGDAIGFVVQTADLAIATATIGVNVQITQEGDFIEGRYGTSVVEIPAGSRSGTFSVKTHNDILDEDDGAIIVTVLFGEGYRIDSANRSIRAVVQDDSDTATGLPILSVDAVARVISEADKADFVISASSAPTNKLTVGINMDDGNGDFLEANQESTFEFPDGETTYTHTVFLDDDDQYEAAGTVTLTLLADTGGAPTYAIAGSPFHFASVTINDNDPQPVISIEAVNPIVPEHQALEFLFRATSAISNNVERVRLSLGGALNEFVDGDALFNQFKTLYINDVLGGNASSYVESTHDPLVLANGLYVDFAANATTARLTIPLNDDNMVEPDGNVSLTILSGDNYATETETNSASILVRDDDVPTVTIAAGSSITEGGMARFDVTMTPPPAAPIVVAIVLSQTGGEFFDIPARLQRYGIQVAVDGTGSREFETIDDNQDEHNGQLIATLYRDTRTPPRYQLGTPVSAGVDVSDNDPDLPRVSVALKSGQASTITEGGSFVVELTANPAPQSGSPLTINLDVQDTGLGTGYFDSFTPNPIMITDGTPVEVTISTHGDDIDEDDGEITVSIASDDDNDDSTPITYLPALAPNNAVSVAVNDDEADISTLVSIETINAKVIEGQPIPFTVTMTPAPATGTTQTVTLENTPSSPYFNSFVPNPVIINESGVVRGIILTNDNEEYEIDPDFVTLAVKGVAGQYRAASVPNNAITVEMVNDDLPTISVADFTVLEPTSADSTHNLALSVSPTPLNDVIITYSVGSRSSATEGTDFELVGSEPYSITLTPTQLTGQIPISIKSDADDERLETIELNLSATNALFENGLSTTNVVGTIAEKPVVSISSRLNRVADSDYFEYTVTAEPSLSSNLTAQLSVLDAREDLVDLANESPTAILTPTNLSVDNRLTFNDNSANNSFITVSIDPDSDYIVHPVRNRVFVQVESAEFLPTVSIASQGDVNEGGVALYTIYGS